MSGFSSTNDFHNDAGEWAWWPKACSSFTCSLEQPHEPSILGAAWLVLLARYSLAEVITLQDLHTFQSMELTTAPEPELGAFLDKVQGSKFGHRFHTHGPCQQFSHLLSDASRATVSGSLRVSFTTKRLVLLVVLTTLMLTSVPLWCKWPTINSPSWGIRPFSPPRRTTAICQIALPRNSRLLLDISAPTAAAAAAARRIAKRFFIIVTMPPIPKALHM
ncbi:hypothetical protein BD289DRAFT_72155 [Coniella lustricola]|uniref:Uncharacterized protein n=1 Tax=Coniella lustricola TaxID=2025994 RepID=A0A2T2ZZN3_9PEZI|nr:hypothetical protein BD289DRAFT_72155 [Coniella lustricola]